MSRKKYSAGKAMKLYQAIASQIALYHGAMADESLDWADFHKRFTLALTDAGLPSTPNSEATKLVLSLSHQDRLVFTAGDLSFVVTPCFLNHFRLGINSLATALSTEKDLILWGPFLDEIRTALELEVDIVCDTLPPKEKIPMFVLTKPVEKEDGYEL